MGNAMYRCIKTNSWYQQWTGYPQSPELTSVRPYQAIVTLGADTWLVLGRTNKPSAKLFHAINNIDAIYYSDGNLVIYRLVGNAWVLSYSSFQYQRYYTLIFANSDIYTDRTLTTIYFAKNTTAAQDAGEITTWKRVNI